MLEQHQQQQPRPALQASLGIEMVHDGNLGVATETDSSISRALYNRNTPSAPYYPGELNFTVEKVHPVFWPGNTITGRIEPEIDVRISLVLIAFYNNNKTHVTQGPIVVAEAHRVKGKELFEMTIPEHINGQSLPMSFRDEQVRVEYRVVAFDLITNEQLKGHLPIQILTPVMINEEDYRVMKIEKKLKTFGIFDTGGIKLGIRVNNPELRPGEDLSIKLVHSGGGNKKKKLKKISLVLYQRVIYNLAKNSTDSLSPPQKDTKVHKVKQTLNAQATLDDDEVKIPLSISMPPLLPSTRRMSATYGNFIRLSYHVKLKITTTGSHNCAWEIPIHVGTTSHPYKCGSAVDMDYVMLRRDDANENNAIYGVIFTNLSTPWPTEKDESERLTLEMSKVNSAQTTELSAFSLGGGGTHASIIAPCDYSESQMQIDASTITNNSSLNNSSAPSYVLTQTQ
ncbi:uncharacterized protein LOC142339979 [Convolutriloba macropyga]|uniref:uncharacterized protein LOC142339979 n=1 Tax=Convolutriloba macropyga TaxID=536237 RepID=UPI003F527193